jgi:FAD synthetase
VASVYADTSCVGLEVYRYLECEHIDKHFASACANTTQFLRHLKVPYCELYDRGYTSLGGTNDTLPNPALKIKGSNSFRPAHELIQDDEERLGRDH